MNFSFVSAHVCNLASGFVLTPNGRLSSGRDLTSDVASESSTDVEISFSLPLTAAVGAAVGVSDVDVEGWLEPLAFVSETERR